MKSMKIKILSLREILMDILDLLVLDKLTSIEIMKLIGREMESDTQSAENDKRIANIGLFKFSST